jgi:hypothetical protein
MGLWMGKTITTTRGEKKDKTKRLLDMMEKRWLNMEKKRLIVVRGHTAASGGNLCHA